MTDLSRPAGTLFLEWLRENDPSDSAAFEGLCSAHPELKGELLELRGAWDQMDSLVLLGLGGMLADRLALRADTHIDQAAHETGETAIGAAAEETLSRLADRESGSRRYRIREEIARGGMGAVLRVWDEDLRRHLAMKVMLESRTATESDEPSDPAPHTLGRFLEEAQVTGQLEHPGIVPVHDLGVDARGQAYFTMKLVKGKTLRDVFDECARGEGGWNRERVLGVILKVCEAMSYAHDRGVIHRDLKPANVMVGRHGEVHVMDWGVARVLSQPDQRDLRPRVETTTSLTKIRSDRRDHAQLAPDSALYTMDGAILGTPAYMPPEQALGDQEAIGPHSDVYAVGAMIYHLLAGHMPYVTPGAAVSNYMVLRWVHEGPPRPLQEVSSEVPAELVAICERAMAREPQQRYSDMGALAKDLAAYMEGRVVAAHQTGAWAEAKKWVQRNRGLAACAAVAVAMLLAGLVTTAWLREQALTNLELANENADEARRQTDLAVESESRARDQERVATERLNDLLSLSAARDLEELTARAETLWPTHPELIPRLEAWLSEAEVLLEGRPEDRESNLKRRPSLAEHRIKLANLGATASAETDAAKLLQARAHASYPRLVAARAERGWQARMLGLEPWPDEGALEAALLREELPTEADALNSLARSLVDPAAPRHGEELRALLLARRALVRSGEQGRAAILDTLAWALFRAGRLDEALAAGEQAAAGDDSLADSRASLVAALARWRGKALEGRRAGLARLEESIEDLELDVGERVFADPEANWWWRRLRTLVAGIEDLHDAQTGLAANTVGESFGWGVAKRLEFARAIEERSVSGEQARSRWEGASGAIAASAQYGGLELAPQMGLLPIGPDPASGLWEFAHLETGEPAVRGEEGKLRMTEEMGLVLVLIPGGRFTMGAQADDPAQANFDPQAEEPDGPPHGVELTAYFLSKYEMTQAQWERQTGVNPSRWNSAGYSARPGLKADREGKGWSALHPVELTSWTECKALMARLGLSLPSEARWDHACRAGTTSVYWTGDEAASLEGCANIRDAYASNNGFEMLGSSVAFDDGHLLHAPVGSYRGNPFGLHDTHGNVWEWCLDGFVDSAFGPQRGMDPVVPWSGSPERVARGGSFYDSASAVRTGYRFHCGPGVRSETLGLRPARDILP